ncbi:MULTISPECIES: methylated-DNA--[protein]-cysteine S-methyltransferase [Anoxybacillus]|uniref:Methylated-DNA--protein-cysteine methyltransferase n=1 Tax=Anoxybacillus flavithermus TaxID=33934 RepID=A0A178TFE9_9BACL|nr:MULTISPECIES: methylated-DNA--[protein]-cysteine S-methyltransferase [Anoxybacillus]MCG6199041.1 methylated-DNA--[protein]-cysteine S-methyltransferase [Anoxybacillus sp. LAT_38]QAV25946.1 methylated-DNA--[protein]-cysteine S-methyltransferase [Neobacillus thermocopriae]ASA96713.1 cysteine methyltransferase [Anoxybacillus flavithermus]ELK21219.1 O6-methylguanine-DNA methyltransferase [Anoxybacillus flavithermus TNO-09.006]MBE2905918.1 methylated-DNA--[protein]-cysteine S-methyltransferase [
MEKHVVYYESPIGWLQIVGTNEGIERIDVVERGEDQNEKVAEPLMQSLEELEQYFQKKRTSFSMPLKLVGTPFQLRVWEALQTIPYGQTVSYADIAKQIGQPKAVRAVGNAVGNNPITIVVPCHRVVRTGGGLGGYAWGIERKKWLLTHETR